MANNLEARHLEKWMQIDHLCITMENINTNSNNYLRAWYNSYTKFDLNKK